MTLDSVLMACLMAHPKRPDIDVAETPFTRAELDERIDYWMRLLSKVVHGEGEPDDV